MAHDDQYMLFATMALADAMVLSLGKAMGILDASGDPVDPKTTGCTRTIPHESDGTAIVKCNIHCEHLPEGQVFQTLDQLKTLGFIK